MRYELDSNGYILTLVWGCNTGECTEYAGEIPTGYSSLREWADNACIRAYYLDVVGNLVLDPDREAELLLQWEQEAADNRPASIKDVKDYLSAVSGDIGGLGDKHFTHKQVTASATWTISHGLNKCPSVTVVDSAGTEVVGDVKHVDINTIRITFSAAFSGSAYIN